MLELLIWFFWFLILTPFKFILWLFIVSFLAWAVGLPITLKFEDGSKAKIRWFKVIDENE